MLRPDRFRTRKPLGWVPAFLWLACLLLSFPLDAPAAQSPSTSSEAPAEPAAVSSDSQALPQALRGRGTAPGALLPWMHWRLDKENSLSVVDMERPEERALFKPLQPNTWPLAAGTMWLRFSLKDLPESLLLDSNAPLYLDLGRHVPGTPAVWHVPAGEAPPQVIEPSWKTVYPLPGGSPGGEIVVRLNGLPGVWFTPLVRSLPQAMDAPERQLYNAGLVLLTLLAALGFARAAMERGEGRLWEGLFITAALVHAAAGVPTMNGGAVTLGGIPGIAAAGVALIFLPHIGRNLLLTSRTSPFWDSVLLCLAWPGAALVLLPFVPDMAWVAPLLDLWPLGAMLALGPAFASMWKEEVAGGGLFILACISLAVGTAFGLWGMGKQFHPALMGEVALLATVLAAFCICAAPRRLQVLAGAELFPEAVPAPSPDLPSAARSALSPQPEPTEVAQRLEEGLRPNLDILLREVGILESMLDPLRGIPREEVRLARTHADNLVVACRDLAASITDLPYGTPAALRRSAPYQTFDIRRIVQGVFADVQAQLPDTRLGLSWYIAPHMGLLYMGDKDTLRRILSLLFMDAVRATRRGTVSLRVRRDPASINPGYIQFTVADDGTGRPPLERGSLMLARVWELTASHKGTLTVHSSPQGMEVTFSLHCVALAEDGYSEISTPPEDLPLVSGNAPNPNLVIVASALPLSRQMFSFYLADEARDVWEARSVDEAVALYRFVPASLIIFDGLLSEMDIMEGIAAIRAFEGEYALPAVPFLGLSQDDAQADRLFTAGCDNSLPQPLIREEFRAMVRHLTSPTGIWPRPQITPHRILPSALYTLTETPHDLAPAPADTPLSPSPEAPASADAVAGVEALPVPEEQALLDPPQMPCPEASTSKTGVAAPGPLSPSPASEKPAVAHPLATPLPDGPAEPQPAALPSEPVSLSLPTPAQASVREVESPSLQESPDRPVAPADSLPAVPQSAAISPPKTEAGSAASVNPGLHLAPPPKRRLGWLGNLFKPTPRVPAEPEDASTAFGSEWVGDPIPLTEPLAEQFTPAPTGDRDAAPELASAVHAAEEAVTPEDSSLKETGSDASGRPDGDAGSVPSSPEVDSFVEESSEQPHPRDGAPDVPEKTPASTLQLISAEAEEEAEQPQAEPDDLPTSPETGGSLYAARFAPAHSSSRRHFPPRSLPFLSLDPNETPPEDQPLGSGPLPEPPQSLSLVPVGIPEASPQEEGREETGEVVELTEEDILEPPLLQQVPQRLNALTEAAHALRLAVEQRQMEAMAPALAIIAENASTLSLHALEDMAHFLEEALAEDDLDLLAQLLPDLEQEVERTRIGHAHPELRMELPNKPDSPR